MSTFSLFQDTLFGLPARRRCGYYMKYLRICKNEKYTRMRAAVSFARAFSRETLPTVPRTSLRVLGGRGHSPAGLGAFSPAFFFIFFFYRVTQWIRTVCRLISISRHVFVSGKKKKKTEKKLAGDNNSKTEKKKAFEMTVSSIHLCHRPN